MREDKKYIRKSFWLLIDLPIGMFAAVAVILLIYCGIAMLMLRNKIKKELNSRL